MILKGIYIPTPTIFSKSEIIAREFVSDCTRCAVELRLCVSRGQAWRLLKVGHQRDRSVEREFYTRHLYICIRLY